MYKTSIFFFLSGEVGFLAEHRRINVAITRARRHLAVVADSETVNHDNFLKSLVEYMSSEGEVRSAHEYLQDSLPTSVNCYTYEQDEVSMSEMTGNEWKKKGTGETRPDSEERDVKGEKNLKSKDNSESGEGTRKLEFSGAEEKKDVSSVVSDKASNLTEENNEQISGKNVKKMKQEKSKNISNAVTNYSRENVEKEIVAFTQDATKKELIFPKSLSSQQRFDVHSVAEKLYLCHESHGEGKERYIVVRKVISASKGLFLPILLPTLFDKFKLNKCVYAIVVLQCTAGNFDTLSKTHVWKSMRGF